jgi:glycosyltransferase involved in cell wall biosynthesis
MMKSLHPKVSVVITCYNLGEYITEAVDSVLAQTCQDFEVLIVDDGSTDPSTRAILAGFDRPGVRVLSMAHSGLAAARNAGIASTTGEYLCALDADDRLERSYLEKATRILDADPTITFVSGWLRTFGDEQWDWKPERCDLPTLLWEDTVLTAALVRRQAVVAVGGYDTDMPEQGDEDWDLWLTLVEHGYRGIILPEVLFDYRRRPDSMSTRCWRGPGHLPLAQYRIAKHADSCRKYLFEVLEHQDAEIAGLLRRNDAIERYIGAELEPTLVNRRQELIELKSRLAAAAVSTENGVDQGGTRAAQVGELEAALEAASNEATALRNSASWRVTRPLRAVYGWWLGERSSR